MLQVSACNGARVGQGWPLTRDPHLTNPGQCVTRRQTLAAAQTQWPFAEGEEQQASALTCRKSLEFVVSADNNLDLRRDFNNVGLLSVSFVLYLFSALAGNQRAAPA